MTDTKKENIIPNAIKIHFGLIRSLIWDYYIYIDRDTYTIDGILNMYEIPVKFLTKELRKPGSDYIFCFLRCRKKYSEAMLTKVFPRLHDSNILLDGKDYLNECENITKIITEYVTTLESEEK